MVPRRSGLTRAVLHRGLHYLIPNVKEKGMAHGLAGHSNWPEAQLRGRKEQAALMTPVNSQKGKMRRRERRRGKGKKRG